MKSQAQGHYSVGIISKTGLEEEDWGGEANTFPDKLHRAAELSVKTYSSILNMFTKSAQWLHKLCMEWQPQVYSPLNPN